MGDEHLASCDQGWATNVGFLRSFGSLGDDSRLFILAELRSHERRASCERTSVGDLREEGMLREEG